MGPGEDNLTAMATSARKGESRMSRSKLRRMSMVRLIEDFPAMTSPLPPHSNDLEGLRCLGPDQTPPVLGSSADRLRRTGMGPGTHFTPVALQGPDLQIQGSGDFDEQVRLKGRQEGR